MTEKFICDEVHKRFEANPGDHSSNARYLRAALAHIKELEAERRATRALLHEIALIFIRAGIPPARNWGTLLVYVRAWFASHHPHPPGHVSITVPTSIHVTQGE